MDWNGKNEKGRHFWQQAKHAWLFSDLLQDSIGSCEFSAKRALISSTPLRNGREIEKEGNRQTRRIRNEGKKERVKLRKKDTKARGRSTGGGGGREGGNE